MEQITIAFAIFCVTGLTGFTVKKAVDMILSHHAEHKHLKEIIPVLQEHKQIHDKINSSLDVLLRSNLSTTRDRLVQSAMCSVKQGYMGLYERETWYSMFESYKELGGNGFVEELKEKKLIICRLRKENNMNQNRLKSWAVWVAVIGQVATILVLAGIEPGQVETWQAIAMAVGEILTVLGILNNPTTPDKF